MGSTTGNPIEIQLSGHDFDQLKQAAAELKAEIATYPGTFDISDNFNPGKPEQKVRAKEGSRSLGISMRDLARQIRQAFYGEGALRIQRGRDDVRVLVGYAEPDRSSLAGVEEMRIRTADGQEIPIEEVADIAPGRAYSVINRVDRKRTITVISDIDVTVANASVIVAELKANFLALLLWPAPAVLAWLGQPAEVAPIAGAYARISIPGTLGMFAFTVLRQSLQALHRVRPIVIVTLLANLINAFLNWVLIFGHLGASPMGTIGSAWATTISRLIMAALLLGLSWPLLREHLRPFHRASFDPAPMGRLLRLGAPIGVQHQLEYGVFAVVGLLMGRMGRAQVAGHQVALNLASLTFMVGAKRAGHAGGEARVAGGNCGIGDARSGAESVQGLADHGLPHSVASASLVVGRPTFGRRAAPSSPSGAGPASGSGPGSDRGSRPGGNRAVGGAGSRA